ncbi:MAG TPA: S1 RNA-binding domain-containing protein [Bryobacteraceae bacterium]|jgi:small subunit ribosomal protein S1|nr:S1 RNA-binding domain-containing protein [Bryobacteraceae bacterium]
MTQSKPFDAPEAASDASFGDILSQFEQSHHTDGGTVEGTVVSVAADAVFVDIGRKMDGIMPPLEGHTFKPGDKVIVSLRGRDDQGNYLLSTVKVEVPKDWTALEAAFASKSTIAGTVLELVKGGLRVDVGVPAFMPASRSGAREMADLEKLVGQSIECRITKLDKDDEDVVVDRRVVLEEMERAAKQERFAALEEGSIIRGTVRTITDFGAFVDLGGVDGLLHVSDMTYQRGIKPSDVVTSGQEIDVKILKINRESRKISLGLKQLSPDPWSLVAEKYPQGSRVNGKVARVADFGAFVELEPGIEGLIHVSEMSWTRKNPKAGDTVKVGESVDVMVLGVNPADKRIALGLKQVLGDPWEEALKKYPVGAVVEVPVTSLAKFGAFVDMGDGLEGMIHIGDISREKRLNHPSEVLKEKQTVRAQVTEQDKERRRFRLSMKALEPTSIDEYIAENKVGDVVAGRILDVSGSRAKVELGEGVIATCQLPEENAAQKKTEQTPGPAAKADLSSLTAMLSAKWKSGGGEAAAAPDALRTGQVRNFKISKVDTDTKRIEVTLV